MPDDVEVIWTEDRFSATLLDATGSWMAHLRVEQWYGDQQVEAELDWVASWLDPGEKEPAMLMAAVEKPALTADDDHRRAELAALARRAMACPPQTPAPFAVPEPTPTGADEWSRHFDLQHSCWEAAFGELWAARNDRGSAGDFRRYRALTQALDWAYAMDNALTLQWRSLPEDVREAASRETDERARGAAEHNAAGMLPFDVDTDPAFVGYVRRLRDQQPYTHWSEVMLAGIFQAKFFASLAWVRGQLIHAATSAPMDLRQFRPGAEPRWKWRNSDDFARGRQNDSGRRAYDELLAGHDVLGLLGHLAEVFFEAGMDLRRRLREFEDSAA
ncbi:MAG: hypothetical protein ACR2GG_07335 [Gemmatimonadaceae bacterium]